MPWCCSYTIRDRDTCWDRQDQHKTPLSSYHHNYTANSCMYRDLYRNGCISHLHRWALCKDPGIYIGGGHFLRHTYPGLNNGDYTTAYCSLPQQSPAYTHNLQGIWGSTRRGQLLNYTTRFQSIYLDRPGSHKYHLYNQVHNDTRNHYNDHD